MRCALVIAVLCGACGGQVESELLPSLTITRAIVRDRGQTVDARIEVVVDGGQRGGRFSVHAGALWPRRPAAGPHFFGGGCVGYDGWRFELDSPSEIEVAPGESKTVRLVASSQRFRACDPDALVAVCGEPITLVLEPDADGVANGGALSTFFACAMPIRRR